MLLDFIMRQDDLYVVRLMEVMGWLANGGQCGAKTLFLDRASATSCVRAMQL